MKYRTAIMAALTVGALLATSGGVMAQAKSKAAPKGKAKVVVKKAPKAPAPENGLVGVHLFDGAATVLRIYGTPNLIEPVNVATSTAGPVGGGGPGMGNPGFGGAPGPGPAAGGGPGARPGMGNPGAMSGAAPITPSTGSDFGFGDTILAQGQATLPPKGGGRGGPGGSGVPMGAPMPPPPGGGGQQMGPGGGGGGGGFSGTATNVTFVRWIYNRPNAKYAFVLNKTGQVVQVEAVGISDSKVRTNRGLTFGSNFQQLIRAYGYPENYEISGDTITVRFLQRNKVAFRLSRLDAKKPHVVTGVVVAGGKA